MKTLSFIGTGRYTKRPVCIDFNKQTVETIAPFRCGIDECYIAPEDMEIRYKKNGKDVVLKADKGDVIVKFYDEDWIIYPVVVIKNKDWKENVLAYIKREEAKKNDAVIDATYSICRESCDCDCCECK